MKLCRDHGGRKTYSCSSAGEHWCQVVAVCNNLKEGSTTKNVEVRYTYACPAC